MVEWNDVIKVGLFGLAALFAGSVLASQIFGFEPLKGGAVVQILAIFGAVLLVWNLATKKSFDFSREDIVALVLVIALIVCLFVLLPQAVPSWFSVVRQNTAAIFGLP